MPGAYAHLTLVGLISDPNHLNRISGFPNKAKAALLDYARYCELGAVSPDYPYLNMLDTEGQEWADLMHYENTGQMIKAGIEALREMDWHKRHKPFAWLLGYAAHVATDVTIHPVVQMKVGLYAENKTAHRVCEMNQDAHIFRRLNLGGIGLAEYLDSGIKGCSDPDSASDIDPEISSIWMRMFQTCYPGQFLSNPPDINGWHKAFGLVVDKAEEGGSLPAFARHVAVDAGMTYPNSDEIEEQYIKGLETPEGEMDYDMIFDRAKENVLNVWALIASGVFSADDEYKTKIDNWNLDTGLNSSGSYAFWS